MLEHFKNAASSTNNEGIPVLVTNNLQRNIRANINISRNEMNKKILFIVKILQYMSEGLSL